MGTTFPSFHSCGTSPASIECWYSLTRAGASFSAPIRRILMEPRQGQSLNKDLSVLQELLNSFLVDLDVGHRSIRTVAIDDTMI